VPEGDTVWRTARRLDQALSGHLLVAADLRVPAYADLDLSGLGVVETVARGKHLLTRLGEGDAAVTLHTHLKMEGSWHLYRAGTPWRRRAHTARVVLRTEDWSAVGFSLGVVEVLSRTEESAAVGHLGPDLLGPDWDLAEAVRRVGAHPHLTVGEALLDQRNLAGIGNLYKAEALFLAGVSPLRSVAEMPDLPKLLDLARRLMLANRESPMQVTTGIARRGEQHWVYRRAGRPCRRCGTTVGSTMQGTAPYERVTYWCPSCQP
jgi:endonuclease-8